MTHTALAVACAATGAVLGLAVGALGNWLRRKLGRGGPGS